MVFEGQGPDLARLLAAVEAAAPVAAADVVGAELAKSLDAREASFLIADFSGQSLVRLSHVSRDASDGGGDATQGHRGRERTEAVPLDGTPHGRALTTQQVELVAEEGGTRVLAPVSSRGEAVGILELCLEQTPDEDTLAAVAGVGLAVDDGVGPPPGICGRGVTFGTTTTGGVASGGTTGVGVAIAIGVGVAVGRGVGVGVGRGVGVGVGVGAAVAP